MPVTLSPSFLHNETLLLPNAKARRYQLHGGRQAVRHSALEAMARYDSAADTARITRAVDLILAGHVTLLPNGEADVRSQTGHGSYHVNGACQCPDFAKAEAGRCKHRYAKALLKRAYRIA